LKKFLKGINVATFKSENSKRERLTKIIDLLSKEYPSAVITLNYDNPFQLLVSTILSAQCTDIKVNQVTKELFEKYKGPSDFMNASINEIENIIYSTGFYKAKAKNIKAASKKIIEEFSGAIPDNMKELLTLPGIGRKTANVILGHCFEPEGIVVDTHVIRISNRLKLTDTKNPEKIESLLKNLIPRNQWVIFTHYFINHGRKICKARNPLCIDCPINYLCPGRNETDN
jgi:endonuclease III